jgi:hypothetical protein
MAMFFPFHWPKTKLNTVLSCHHVYLLTLSTIYALDFSLSTHTLRITTQVPYHAFTLELTQSMRLPVIGSFVFNVTPKGRKALTCHLFAVLSLPNRLS